MMKSILSGSRIPQAVWQRCQIVRHIDTGDQIATRLGLIGKIRSVAELLVSQFHSLTITHGADPVLLDKRRSRISAERVFDQNHSRRHRGSQGHPRAKIARARSGRIVIRENKKDDFAYFASETQMTSVSLRTKAHFLA